jgi:hypothetical protein
MSIFSLRRCLREVFAFILFLQMLCSWLIHSYAIFLLLLLCQYRKLNISCVVAVMLAGGVPPADLRLAEGMCPELLSVPAHTIAAALRFLTEAPCVPEPDLPRLLVFPVAAWLRPTLFFLPVLASPTCTAAVSRSPAPLQPRAQ